MGLTVVIVNWNTLRHLEGCLNSLAQYPSSLMDTEIIVVDNGSTDGSAAWVREHASGVRLIENAVNEGFTRANNRAIRVSQGRYLLLINSDARLSAGALDTMAQWMETHPQAGVVGPRLVYGDGRWQRSTAGRAPSLRAAFNHHFCLDRFGLGEGLYLARDVRQAFRPDWVSSACMLARRSAVEAVGLLDESIFVYMDDVDLCARLRAAAWEVWYCPAAAVTHYMSQSTTSQAGEASPAALRAFNRYFAARHGPLACTALRAIELAGSAARALAYSVAAQLRPGDAFLRGRARSHLAFCRVCLEPSAVVSSPSPRAGETVLSPPPRAGEG